MQQYNKVKQLFCFLSLKYVILVLVSCVVLILLSLYRYFVQPKLHCVVRGPGHSDEGHPGGSENEGADPEGAAATSPAGH